VIIIKKQRIKRGDLFENFLKDGCLHTKKVFTDKECNNLLASMINDWLINEHTEVRSPRCRVHCPMTLNTFTTSMLRKMVSVYGDVLKEYLDKDNQWLVEFSSLCAFPGAESQKVHSDLIVNSDSNHKIVTIFVNLFNVNKKDGPLEVFPGSHKVDDFVSDLCRKVENGEIPNRLMTGPAGSSVLVDGRIWHRGTGVSWDGNFRPVFYASFGTVDLLGPLYSIQSSYHKKYTLSDFDL